MFALFERLPCCSNAHATFDGNFTQINCVMRNAAGRLLAIYFLSSDSLRPTSGKPKPTESNSNKLRSEACRNFVHVLFVATRMVG